MMRLNMSAAETSANSGMSGQTSMMRARAGMTSPSLAHGGAMRISEAHIALERVEREQAELQARKEVAHSQLLQTLKEELGDGLASLNSRHAQVMDNIKRCTVGSQTIKQSASDLLANVQAQFNAVRQMLDAREEEIQWTIRDSCQKRISLLDEQTRTFGVAGPEIEELGRRMRAALEKEDATGLVKESRMLIPELERMTERLNRLPSPADEAALDHLALLGFTEALQGANGVGVINMPAVFYVVPCTGPVSGGSSLRVEGNNLAGDDIKVFVGGVICDHVVVKTPSGASHITCVLPPCYGELVVDVIVEVDGRQVVGGATFQYLTPKPQIEPSALMLSPGGHTHEIIIRGEGFATVKHLNLLDLRAVHPLSGGDQGQLLPCDIARCEESVIVAVVPASSVPPGSSIFASVVVCEVSSGDHVLVAVSPSSDQHSQSLQGTEQRSMPGPHHPHGSSPSPGQFTAHHNPDTSGLVSAGRPPPSPSPGMRKPPGSALSSLNSSGISSKIPASIAKGLKRVMTSERIFGSGSGVNFVGVRVDKVKTGGIIGVMMLDVSPGTEVSSDTAKGWMYTSAGNCVSTWTEEGVRTGFSWGAGDVIGIEIDFDGLSVTFYLNGNRVHRFGSIVGPVVAMVELTDPTGAAAFIDFNPRDAGRGRSPPAQAGAWSVAM